MNMTYYETNARAYAERTFELDMTDVYARFLELVSVGGRILDFGSGAGRDALAFSRRGYVVDAVDGSKELAQICFERTGIAPIITDFLDFRSSESYDGVWCCASLVHIPTPLLGEVLNRLTEIVKHGGAIYMSFKFGTGKSVSADGRQFYDQDLTSMRSLVGDLPNVYVHQIWQSRDCRPLSIVNWLNVILLRN
jgi:2-polyprenyl-3-methyl-5-hydroxy-6-metoxy-1,4-benzoquinol methylase